MKLAKRPLINFLDSLELNSSHKFNASFKEALDEQLSKYLKKGWRLNRINEIDLAILEVALYEMQNSKVIDPVAALFAKTPLTNSVE